MKKILMVLLSSLLLFLGGCSFLNDAQDTLTYINEATDYLTAANEFANDVPALAQQAVQDLQAAEDLQALLQDMQQQMESFNNLQAPQIAADLHGQIVEQNNILNNAIETYLTSLKEGLLDPAILENTELVQTVQDITSIIEQIQTLGE
nr:DUF6376 family protein [Neobacillus sp. Marseille-Q6967]